MLTQAQSVLVLGLIAMDEGTAPLSGREMESVLVRRVAQVEFIRSESASIGGQSDISETDWGVANAWVSELLPYGYKVALRPLLSELLEDFSRSQVRRTLELVSAVVQWDGAVSVDEALYFEELARVAKLNDKATLDDLLRVGRRLARAS